MNSIIIEQLFDYFSKDFIYYGTPTGNEKEIVSLYVEPNGISMNGENSFPLKQKLTHELKKNESHLFLILGGPGMGKTACALNLAKFYWEKITKFPNLLKYKTITYDDHVIPIYINLQSVKGDWSNVLQSYVRTKTGVDDPAIYNAVCNMKNVLLILDAYDEIATSEKTNIWDDNKWGYSNFKAVIFSRPECFESLSKMERFFYYTKSGRDGILSASRFFIQPYTDDHIIKYVDQFINLLIKTPKVCVRNGDNNGGSMFVMTKFFTHGTKWETKKSPYYEWLGQNELSPVPQLKRVASNPLLLTLIMLVLPGVASRVGDNENEMMKICSTETGLYDEFLAQWFSFQCKKLENSKKWGKCSKIFDYMPALFGMYAQNLATFVLKRSRGYLTENYELTESDTLQQSLLEPYHDDRLIELKNSDETMRKFFTDDKDEHIKILRNGCPLHFCYDKNLPRDGFLCRFIHISLVEFLVSHDVFQYVRGEINFIIYREISHFNANNSQRSRHLSNDSIGITYQAINSPNVSPRILYFLADRAKNNNEFSDLLLKIVKTSSETSAITLSSPRNQLEGDEKKIYIQNEIKQLSANCMTILILSERNFSGENLRNVQIPGADLRNGIFAGADLRGADCEGCKFGRSVLTNAKLQGSNLKDITVGQDKLKLDDKLHSISYFDNFLYCSFSDKIVQYDLDSGAIIRYFVVKTHPNWASGVKSFHFEFIASAKKLFVWSDDLGSILVFDLETGRPLVGISDNLTMLQGVVQLSRYGHNENVSHSSESVYPRQNVLQLHNVQDLNVIVVTVYFTEHNDNIKKNIICFPWTTTLQKNIESLFPIPCNYKGCAVSETTGYFALAEDDGVKICSLFTGKINQICFDASRDDAVIVTFSQSGRFLGILCKEDYLSSSEFQLLDMTNTDEKVDINDCFSEIGVPETYIFSNNVDNMLATEHDNFTGSNQINIWTVVHNRLMPLQKIPNYDPNLSNFNRLSSVQYSFCRDDTAIAHLSAFSGANEISIVSIHDLRSNSTLKKGEPTIASVAISNDGKYWAILSFIQMEWETEREMNLEIFEKEMNFPRLLRHATFYPTKSDRMLRPAPKDVLFDQTNKYLLVIGSDLTLFYVSVETGRVRRRVNLLTPPALIDERSDFLMHSNFRILPHSYRLIVMHSHKPSQTDEYSKFFAVWNLDKVNPTEIFRQEILEMRNIKIEEIGGICQDFDGNWIAAHTPDSVFIWSTKNVAEFRTFHPKSKFTDQDDLHGVKFGPKADPDSVYMIFLKYNRVAIAKVSESTIEMYRTIKDNYGGIACMNNSLRFATFTRTRFYVRDIEDTKFFVPLKLWYQPDGCRLISKIGNGIVDQNHFLIYSWGTQSNETSFSCIKMNSESGWWQIVRSSRPPHEFQAFDCNIGNCYELDSKSFNSLLTFGIKGKPLSRVLANETKYIPLPHLFCAYITNEKRSERKDPIIATRRDENSYITENAWTISAVVKKSSNKCSKECSAPHMLLIIEGMRNGHRFILKAHKRYIDKIAIVCLERMYDVARFRNYAKSLKSCQWPVTKDEGMMIIHSIQDDQHADYLRFNLLNKNCVEWCRSKIRLIPRYKNVGRKKFLSCIRDLIIPPRYLLNAN